MLMQFVQKIELRFFILVYVRKAIFSLAESHSRPAFLRGHIWGRGGRLWSRWGCRCGSPAGGDDYARREKSICPAGL